MRIAVDVASADNPLEEIVGGCAYALQEDKSVEVIAVGPSERIAAAMSGFEYDKSRFHIHQSVDVIGMHEAPASAIKAKKNSSVVRAAYLVKEGEANGFFSPGNTGATLASSLMIIGRLKGVLRPALAALVPTINARRFVFLDVGANVDCTPEYITQFAIMGEIFAKYFFKIKAPKVALLNVGEEITKGDSKTKKTYEKLSKLPFDFIGNIEPTKMYSGAADVVVSDGFVGNLVLKDIEGMSKTIMTILKNSIKKSFAAQIGAMLMKKPVFDRFKRDYSADSYGGVPLVGVKGSVFVGHGHSSENAVKNGILACAKYSANNVSEHIVEELKKFGHSHSGLF